MRKMPVISFVFLLTLAAAPSFAQKAPLSAPATQNKNQSEMPLFTHTEVVQFIHTVQAQAAGWKDTVSSIKPPTLHIYGEEAANIEGYKGFLLGYLNEIGKLRPSNVEKSMAEDLFDEFEAFNDLDDVGDSLGQLGDILSSYASGQIDAAELLQIEKEVKTAKLTLYGEILSRILNIARSEKSGGCPSTGLFQSGLLARTEQHLIPAKRFDSAGYRP
jgi:hypothetical protein